jgi:hypothetical protein
MRERERDWPVGEYHFGSYFYLDSTDKDRWEALDEAERRRDVKQSSSDDARWTMILEHPDRAPSQSGEFSFLGGFLRLCHGFALVDMRNGGLSTGTSLSVGVATLTVVEEHAGPGTKGEKKGR